MQLRGSDPAYGAFRRRIEAPSSTIRNILLVRRERLEHSGAMRCLTANLLFALAARLTLPVRLEN